MGRLLGLIGRPYQLEAEWDQAQVGGQRAALRQEHFARPLARLYRLVSALQVRVLPRTGLGQACANLKDVLTRLPAMTSKDDLTPLLPTHWQPTSAS